MSSLKNSDVGVVGGGRARVSLPSSVRKTIQNIKEITGTHSEEEIYTMLKECSMDPNETVQRLLFQDTFHEVKRKRDKRKENSINEAAELKWQPGMQGRRNKGNRGNLTSHHVMHGGVKNGSDQVSDKTVLPSSVPTVEAKNISSSSSATANVPSDIASGSNSIVRNAHIVAGRGIKHSKTTTGAGSGKLEGPMHVPFPAIASKSPIVAVGNRDMHGKRKPNSVHSSTLLSSPPSSGAYLSASDPVILPSQDSRPAGVVGTIRREVGSQPSPIEHVASVSNERRATSVSDAGSSYVQVKMPSKFQGPGKNQLQESSQTASSTHGGSSVSRPSSNYNNRSQVIGPQKVGSGKEWKPKSISSNLPQGTALAAAAAAAASSDVSTVSADVNTRLQPLAAVLETKEVTADLQKKFEESHISDAQHVIIPTHLHVPDAEKFRFCFGSFDTSFDLATSSINGPEKDRSPPLSETSEGIEEAASEQFPSNQNAPAAAEDTDFSVQSPPTSHRQENISVKGDDISSSAPECSESKQETLQESNQYSVAHTSPNYSFGFVPPMLGNQLPPFESSESQPRDVSRHPNFLVQQPIDPTSYYAQFYRSGADGDGRISPFHSSAPHTSQEGVNHLVLSTSPTPLMTQAAGNVQSPVAVTQQPVPVFRNYPPNYAPNYPPNYFPYGHYYSPLYVPPTAIHPFLSNGAFPQQPQTGSIYPPPQPAAARYPLSQYRPGANVGNSAHMGVPGTYGPYGSSVGYNPSSSTTSGNPASSEDPSPSEFRENNVYVSGQQSEGSGVWITAPGRDVSSLQANSLYNLPQGQLAFTPAQPGHGTFPGVYHPTQPVTGTTTVHPLLQQSQTMAGPVDMVGPTANAYQQSQHSQNNWPNGY